MREKASTAVVKLFMDVELKLGIEREDKNIGNCKKNIFY